ncbi:MAG: DoxX family protein [Planctomycetes bacterium]|nr:DoxX family protein [Planctomycetota bacterium]
MQQMADAVQGAASLLARLMISLVFASAVANKVMQFSSTAAYMQQEGVPVPKFALFGATGLLLIGCVSLILGAWTRIGAMFLLTFLAAATFYFHDFWQMADPASRQLQTIQFMKNVAIGGGLLALVAFGGGPWSIDGWIALKREEAENSPKPRTTAKTQ